MASAVKQEIPELAKTAAIPTAPIDISSDSESSSNSVESSDIEDDLATTAFIESITCKSRNERNSDDSSPPPAKKPKRGGATALGFQQDLPVTADVPLTMARVLPDSTCVKQKIGQNSNKTMTVNSNNNQEGNSVLRGCKQFWKAGDYEGDKDKNDSNSGFSTVGMDHARIHPKFLHSNATSHKWALGAFAELLDNSLDEVCNGATYANIDMLKNKKDGSLMLVVEDNGGGMTPDKMRQCMSLGYSAKSKMANTIGQYGNGFKTSTMRLGADVIVFSRCQGINGTSPTQTIGLLSYTFLRATGKEDIVVPTIDYEKSGKGWNKMMRASTDDWTRNLETIVQWSPYASEEDLLQQFKLFRGHGTLIVIYNLWEDDEGHLELDFDTDPHDIQIRGVNRDEKSIQMSKQYPNSRHFLTYRHSLRSYASILYLRLPAHFRIILRGQDIKHHNIVNDMMMTKVVTYKPLILPEGMAKDSNMVAKVTLGFVKDAHSHIDIQGFNVYHKNRLIKPFWRVWNAAGSDGRGVIGVLEANFVEPAHDKQGFERTNVLQRLEQRLIGMQKEFWSKNCHAIGYAPRRRTSDFPERDSSVSDKEKSPTNQNGHASSSRGYKRKTSKKFEKGSSPVNTSSEDGNCNEALHSSIKPQQDHASDSRGVHIPLKVVDTNGEELVIMDQVTERSIMLRTDSSVVERLEEAINDLSHERDSCKSLKIELEKANERISELEKEQEALIQVLVEEKTEREQEEERLRKSLTKASNTIDELLQKVRQLEGRTTVACKVEKE
ncbi:protein MICRORCHIDIA 7-like [Argentina anserina]|uniref:protein MICRORCHIDIA 7-like n=1 Tax=Argentina anserina TaxID=57926 RepID=UPI0021765D53|nr:protein MICRORCHIDIA 7-like [Potentilla anserina]